ncbi:MAG: OmpH family outer membrane protein [Candidatus Dadabacteria bacterium]
MKSGTLIFNAVLLVLVAILFYLHFSSNKKATISAQEYRSAQSTNHGDCRIAYFEMDSLTNSFSMVKDVKSELAKEEDQMNSELSRLQKVYNDRLAQYQRQGQTMSQIESERANRDMLQLQESIRGKKQEMDQKYQDLYMRKMQEVKSKIENFLKEYNKSHGYSYILAYEPGIIYYRDTIYNITSDLVKGLNAQYSRKK